MAENTEKTAATEKKGTPCPVCSRKLKKGEKMVYCEEYKPKKDGSEWYNEGTCDFRITYKNKIFGRDLTDRDIRTLLEGGSIKNKNGDSAILDVDYEYFVRIDYKEKKEDRDF